MTPPNKPPDKKPKKPKKSKGRRPRYPYWERKSKYHPMVQPRPGFIFDGMHTLAAELRQLRSSSPDAREFSRFSSQAATPDTTEHGPPLSGGSREQRGEHRCPVCYFD